jgi:hypothetical protein
VIIVNMQGIGAQNAASFQETNVTIVERLDIGQEIAGRKEG